MQKFITAGRIQYTKYMCALLIDNFLLHSSTVSFSLLIHTLILSQGNPTTLNNVAGYDKDCVFGIFIRVMSVFCQHWLQNVH